mgnify:CR=1 FL=1
MILECIKNDESQSNTELETESVEEQRIALPTLPPPLGDMISEVAKVRKVHQDLPTLIGLATISAAIGKSCRLDTGRFRTPANIFALPTGSSGSGKSTAYNDISAPLFDVEKEELETWNTQTRPNLEAKKKLLKSEEKRLQSKSHRKSEDYGSIVQDLARITASLNEIEKQLEPPRLLAEDATSQKLGALLEASNETLAVFSSEAGDILSNIAGRYNSSGRTDEHLFLKGFTGEPHRVDRVGRDPVSLDHPCMTICWITTPDELAGLFRNERFVTGGLLPRFLICESESSPMKDDGTIEQFDPEIQKRWNQCIRGILEIRNQEILIPSTKEALKVFIEYGNRHAEEHDREPEADSFNSRRREIAERLSVCLHVLEHGAKNVAGRSLTKEIAEMACALSSFYSQAHLGILRRLIRENDMKEIDRLHSTAMQNGVESADGYQTTLRELIKNNGYKRERIELLSKRYPEKIQIVTTSPGSSGGRPSILVVVTR